MRQAHGVLENRALREHMSIKRLPLRSLPATSQEMVNSWLVAQPTEARSLFRKQPSCFYAARKLRIPRNWSSAQVPPSLVRKRDAEQEPALAA